MPIAPLLTALLAWLSFPAVGVWPLAFVAWIPLLVALRTSRPRDAFFRGWIAGAVMNGLGGSFLYATLLRESGLPSPAVLLVFAAFAGWQGLPTALAAWLAVRGRARGWPLAPAFALAATGLEAAFPMPLPWSFAAAVSHVRPLVQIADVGGATLVSGLLYAVNAAFADLVERQPSKRRARLFVPPTLVGAALAYGAFRLGDLDAPLASAPRARVGVVHTQRRAHDPADLPALLDRVNALGTSGAELVVTSESSLPGVFPEEDLTHALSLAGVDRVHVDAIFGATIGDHAPTNSALTMSGGQLVERYDKHRLLPFAEFFPMAEAWPSLARATRAANYRAGRDRDRRSGSIRAALSICYEDTLADVVRKSSTSAPSNLLVNLTNDGWFDGSSEPDLHFALARLRAVELRRSLVRSANLGRSAVVDPTGDILAEADGADGDVVVDVPLLDTPTLYARIGEGPGWAALGVALAFALVRSPRSAAPNGPRARFSPSTPS